MRTDSVSVKPSRWLSRQVASVKLWLYLTLSVALVSGLLVIVQAFCVSTVVDRAYIHHESLTSLWPWIAAIAGLFLGRALLIGCRHVVSFQIGGRLRQALRMSLAQHLLAMNPLEVAQAPAGSLSTVMIEQIEALQLFYARYYPQMAFAVLMPCLILAVVWPQNWISGLILLITAPLIPLFMALVGMGAAALNRQHFKWMERLGGRFLDLLQGMTILKVFGMSAQQSESLEAATQDYRRRTMSVLRVAFLSSAVLEFFASVSIALIATWLGLSLLGYLHWGEYGHVLSLKTALFILLLAPEFYLPLKELGAYYHDRAAAIGASESIMAWLSKPRCWDASHETPDQAKRIDVGPGVRVTLREVSFGYSGSPDLGEQPLVGSEKQYTRVLNQISMEIEPGERVAIVGESGAGKSTLLQLIAGFYVPTQGDLCLNGISRREADWTSWRDQVAFLMQQPQLIPGSILDNIRIAQPDASTSAVIEAARRAGLDESWLMAKTRQEVGEQNAGLSVGQAQRIALARAYLKRASVVLLDEPTAYVDDAHQEDIMTQIFAERDQTSWVIVTHHLNTIQAADRIYVLDQGRCVAEGSFDELSKTSALFQAYVASISIQQTETGDTAASSVASVSSVSAVHPSSMGNIRD